MSNYKALQNSSGSLTNNSFSTISISCMSDDLSKTRLGVLKTPPNLISDLGPILTRAHLNVYSVSLPVGPH